MQFSLLDSLLDDSRPFAAAAVCRLRGKRYFYIIWSANREHLRFPRFDHYGKFVHSDGDCDERHSGEGKRN
jgi:hypothetical protein